MSDIVYTRADAFLDDQMFMGYWRPEQWITLELSDDDEFLAPAYCGLSAEEARELAFRLLVLAEHADRRAGGHDDPDQEQAA